MKGKSIAVKEYTFKIKVIGVGETAEDAYYDAMKDFLASDDPGVWEYDGQEYTVEEVEDG